MRSHLVAGLAAAMSVVAMAADLTITESEVNVVSGTTVTGPIGYASSTRGEAVVMSGGSWIQADADNNDDGKRMGIVITPAVASGELGVVQISGMVDIGASLTIGDVLVASGTAGNIAPIADLSTGTQYIHVVGVAENSVAKNIRLILKTSSILAP